MHTGSRQGADDKEERKKTRARETHMYGTDQLHTHAHTQRHTHMKIQARYGATPATHSSSDSRISSLLPRICSEPRIDSLDLCKEVLKGGGVRRGHAAVLGSSSSSAATAGVGFWICTNSRSPIPWPYPHRPPQGSLKTQEILFMGTSGRRAAASSGMGPWSGRGRATPGRPRPRNGNPGAPTRRAPKPSRPSSP